MSLQAISSEAAHGHDDESGLPHITPLGIYFGVWAALTVLTVITVLVSYVDFGEGNLIVAMAVAVLKASLVAAFFMHLKWDNKLNTVVFMSSLVFLAIFFFLVFADMSTRGKVDPAQGTFEKVHGENTGMPAGAAHGEHATGHANEHPAEHH